jgi:hypothetical protein
MTCLDGISRRLVDDLPGWYKAGRLVDDIPGWYKLEGWLITCKGGISWEAG